MLIKLQEERDIESIEDLRFKKQQLIKKADKKLKKVRKKVRKITKEASTPVIYDEILSQFDLQHSLLNMLPMVLKYREQIGSIGFIKDIKNSPNKRFAAITFGAVITALFTYFSLSKNSTKSAPLKKKKEEKRKEKPKQRDRDDLFV